ncbi:N-acetyl-gamma-glutamyl-phosphate reductase [Nesterenkonia sp. E16_7]|uniref:N-acetyl-gamma-glutamyl-phosphate reductase n=1 Tax=unclassified Nesterenkonia TaxID=2629769 RepID=UPI001A9223BC|nr:MULTISPECIES: N-acetyl-gamma-glutamyl-phosphate reductase [unclassified Nesterenkonia]MBO0594793.1 N-acetyl-gamma-glutamyl-phosphate reductase [Nesterenkonia sp. E16_10]MBO0597042.1 N-acetyl-gamma-glutamyl-phosphate reductase [Nesterenkonia sp. E16_7]
MTYSIAVSGASGYAGGEVLRLLAGHPEVEIGAVTAHSSAGERLGSVQPHLLSLADRVLLDTTAENLAGHDVVFLALPHGSSAEIAAQLGEDTIVIDAAADHRLESAADWEKFYGSAHQGTWPYGLPELPGARAKLTGARRIAVPGCYPTTIMLGLAPALAAGLVQPDDIVIVAATGTSGAGKALKPHLLSAEVIGGMSPYGVGGVHRHTPEIEQGLGHAAGVPVQVSFTPTLAPMPRGILATSTAKLAPGTTEAALRAAYREHYDGEAFVHLLPEGQWPATKQVVGSNHVTIQLAVDEHAGRAVVVSAADNLTKGTAGGAVQSMNIALGVEETTGLNLLGVSP